MPSMKNYSSTKSKIRLLILVYGVSALYWYILTINNVKTSSANYWYQTFLAIIPLMGALFGFLNSRKWGGLKSQLGRATFFLSAGLASWGLGQCYWSYVTIRQINQIPYPSWADVGYVIALPLWVVGISALTLAAGARFSLRRHTASGKKIIAGAFGSLVVAAGSTALLLKTSGGIDLHTGSLGKHLIDLAYPIGDVFIVTIAVLSLTLLLNYLGGRYRVVIMSIIVGFILMYVTDFTFSYVIANNTYFNGHFVDFLFSTVMAILSWGITLLAPPAPSAPIPQPHTSPAPPQSSLDQQHTPSEYRVGNGNESGGSQHPEPTSTET
jgi:hypothetical protein